jgi:P4 family phage/plasmid primase-like protien
MSAFRDYVASFTRQPGDPQTHTWFSPTKKTCVLTVPFERNEEFLEKVYEYISKTSVDVLENPKRGENSITEKVDKNINKFRMFADIDFKVELFEKHDLPTDKAGLSKCMSDLVKIYDKVISDNYGVDFICDRVLATRLPYKIHIIYPSVVVNKKIAEALSHQFAENLKKDPRFSAVLQKNENINDKSVYNTGLRMVGMHKSHMGKKESMERELTIHENLFRDEYGEHSYRNCYRFTDPDSFQPIPMNLDLFKRASIRADEEDEYTVPLQDSSISSLLHLGNKGKGKAISTVQKSSGRMLQQMSGGRYEKSLFDDEDGGESSGSRNIVNFSSYDETLRHATLRGEGRLLTNDLVATLKYLLRQYNHIIKEDKVKLAEWTDDSGEVTATLIIPLETKECHVSGRLHEGNRGYLLVDRKGSRQKCHDHECKGKEHKLIRPSRFPNAVRNELIAARILKEDLVLKDDKRLDEGTQEEKLTALTGLIDRVRPYYPKNELSIDGDRLAINEAGAYIGLRDLWCEICKRNHERPCTYFQATESGKIFLKCTENPIMGLFYPNPPLQMDTLTRQFIFSNCNVSFNQTIVNNYHDSTGDVSVDFEKEPIFEDDELNHLIYESLANNSWSIAKVVHHVGKFNFNCTRFNEWYAFKNHRWVRNSETSINFFLSEKVSHHYRQVRDYYKDNTVNADLRNKRVLHIQKIIDKLSNSNTKAEILKEAKTYFVEQDYYKKDEKPFDVQLDSKRHLLCFSNGVFDLDAGVFRDGSPYDFITMSVGYDYDPISDPEKRKIIEQFFTDMQPIEEEREYLILFLSSCLHGMTKDETFHVFTGGSSNGKSVIRDMMMYVLGDYFENIPANLLTKERPSSSSPQPDIVKLKGKRFVVGSEPEAGHKINTGFMKWITGNDPLSARLLHSNEIVTFFPHFKLALLCNDIPLMDCNDDGVWRRSRIKDFPVTFSDNPRPGNPFEKLIDRTLKSRLEESCKSEFMLFLMEYYARFKTMKGLRPTRKIMQMVEKHKKRSNNLQQFIEDQTEEAEGHALLLTDLYPRYLQWIRNELPGEPPLIKTKVIDELQRLKNVEFSKHCRVRGRSGGGQNGLRNRKFINREEDYDIVGDDDEDAMNDGAA